MDYEYNDRKQESVYSKRLKAGKRRTYFFDVRETRGNDFFLTITESRKRFNDDGYDRHKIFLYKEDFNKFIKGLTEAVDFVKTDLMPDYDFDIFNHEGEEMESGPYIRPTAQQAPHTEELPTTELNESLADSGTDHPEVEVSQAYTAPEASADKHISNLSTFEAEPLRAETGSDDDSSEEETIDKLESEEVEKW